MTQAYEMALPRHILKVRYQTFRGEVAMTHKLDDQVRVNLLCPADCMRENGRLAPDRSFRRIEKVVGAGEWRFS